MSAAAHAPAHSALARAAGAAALAVLAWAGATAAGLAEIAGVPGYGGLGGAAVVGAVLGATRVGRAAVRAAAAAVALWLVVATVTPLAAAVVPPLVRRDRPAADSGAAVDAVAVLSGSVGDDGLVTRQGLDRLLDGLALARRTGRPLLVSVVHPGDNPRQGTWADERRLAALAGVDDRLWAVDSVHSTHDEALRMTALARARGWRRIALVTSPAHTRRACATFERAGLAVVCTPARARDAAYGGAHPLDSGADRLRALADWLYERVGWAVYRARGWV